MELECRSGARRLQCVVCRHCRVQGVECRIQAAVISLVRLGDRRRDGFNRGKDGQLLAVGVPDQHFVEESEALDRRREPRFAAGGVERRRVDAGHVAPEGIVDRRHCIQWFCHNFPPCTTD